ncbi:DUF4270 domain-containing protein [Flavobacterium sp. AG291]|uniref:DUF4270 domain-containing protein n=1 Tax=Flavobacterium sp. AG291 TaxID=2184000 RepID=UPI000E0C405C|nr:DUF4270 domain-containing protein [Flavobacterium sp. AG291]RDI08581.1 uncharacterized protein DUF4270 [Flavobacterium sp. AG291]
MTNSSFLKKLVFALTAFSVVLFVSCDDDFNLLGADVIDGDIHSDMEREEVSVVAYDRPTGAVQANNMTQNQLGVYDNPVFGKTVSNFVTQVVMASENPTLYEPVVDSVYLYIPYYTTAKEAGEDGETIYEWGNSLNTYIFGDPEAKFNLKIYQNGYYLRDTDPGATDNTQRYFSDDKAMVENMVVGQPLFEGDTTFSLKEVRIDAKVTDDSGNVTDKVVERKKPGLYIQFDPARFNELFFSQANRGNLINNTVFKNYFRGLYFKVEQLDKAVMNIPDFASGTITVKMRDYEALTSGTTAGPDLEKGRIRKTVTFNLKGNTINFFDNTYNTDFNTAVSNSDVTLGDDRLYLKGGAGSMAVVSLNDAKINELIQTIGKGAGNNVLINEANLVFYVDNNAENGMGGNASRNVVAPWRLYLYDLKNRKPIIDYSMDATTYQSNPKLDKYNFGGIIDTLSDGRIAYKIRLTNHIKNIIKGDSTNVKLGLVVTDNINITTNYKLKTPFTEGDIQVKDVPYSSVQNLLGTKLYGSNVPADGNGSEKNGVKLEIYYSKPKE